MKSKVQLTKEAQGYIEKSPACCGTCANFRSEMVTMPAPNEWSIPYLAEKNRRCAFGEFAVKKTSHCNLYERAK